jgi:TolB-like protein/Tfp pilus assembly protein PilF
MRYQSAGEVRSELSAIEKGIPTTERIEPKRKPITSKEITVTLGYKKLFIPALVVIAVVIVALIIIQTLPKEKAALIPSGKPSIAVLPFEDLSNQKDQEILCDGMTDEIIAKLSRVQGWKVMNRNSVMLYKKTDKDIKVIGHELDVATILLGSVRKEGDDIRVTAQLVNVEDRFQIWSDTYEQRLEHVFIIQSDIAEKIVEALQMELSSEVKEQIQKKPTEKIEAYNLYLQGRFFWNKRTEEGLNKSIEFFEKAIEIDSNYALAYAGLADSYNMHAAYDYLPNIEAIAKAKAAATKALEIDESLAEAHTSMALIKEFSEWDWLDVEKEFKRAIELNPNYAIAHQWYAEYLAFVGRGDEAVAEIKIAQELDPLSLIINTEAARIYYFNRKFDLAIKQFQRTLDMDQNFPPAHSFLSLAYVQKGMCENAIQEVKKALELLKNRTAHELGALGTAYGFCGMKEEAYKVLNELLELSKNKYVSPTSFALMYVALGENDKALEWLEKAVKEKSVRTGIVTDPRFDSIRSYPRFKALLRRMNLE